MLRGKGMPSLYSWSCKRYIIDLIFTFISEIELSLLRAKGFDCLFLIRSYKSGYVWNDLAENDIIYPTEGAEYVLKGSELVEGCSGLSLFKTQNHAF